MYIILVTEVCTLYNNNNNTLHCRFDLLYRVAAVIELMNGRKRQNENKLFCTVMDLGFLNILWISNWISQIVYESPKTLATPRIYNIQENAAFF